MAGCGACNGHKPHQVAHLAPSIGAPATARGRLAFWVSPEAAGKANSGLLQNSLQKRPHGPSGIRTQDLGINSSFGSMSYECVHCRPVPPLSSHRVVQCRALSSGAGEHCAARLQGGCTQGLRLVPLPPHPRVLSNRRSVSQGKVDVATSRVLDALRVAVQALPREHGRRSTHRLDTVVRGRLSQPARRGRYVVVSTRSMPLAMRWAWRGPGAE
jgi:hypothetical protein